MFYTLAQAVCSCINVANNQFWRQEMLHRVLDELFRLPQIWKKDNVAGFLLFCSEKVRERICYGCRIYLHLNYYPQLILDYLKNKLDTEERDQFSEVARLLIDMIKVSYRFDNDLCEGRGIGKILDVVIIWTKFHFI